MNRHTTNLRGIQSIAGLVFLLSHVDGLSARQVVVNDPPGDASIQRTDIGNDGPLNPAGNVPDLLSVTIRPWLPLNVQGQDPDPARGLGTPTDDIFELVVVFNGFLNPPGPIGLGTVPFDPFRFGPSPVYGFIDIDVDVDRDTGGEFDGAERTRYLANIARFGETPSGTLGQRVAFEGSQLDSNFTTPPFVERSGADFSLVMCGCFYVSIVSRVVGNADSIFEPGEVWDIRGRFFQRAAGYQLASASFGGSAFGLYDPQIVMRFAHDLGTNQTSIVLRYPLTMEGAAALFGGPLQIVDLDVSNHTSVLEGLEDIIDGAMGTLSGPTFELTRRWATKNAVDSLNVNQWRLNALMGMTYSMQDPGGATFAWTDAAGPHLLGDFNINGVTDLVDVGVWDTIFSQRDGSALDADGAVNGTVTVPNFGPWFSIYDVTGDGLINALDRAVFVPVLQGDANGDCVVDFPDVTTILQRWGNSAPPDAFLPGDTNGDGVVSFPDITTTLNRWGTTCGGG